MAHRAKPLGGIQLNYEIVNNKTEYPVGIKNLFWNFNLATGTASTSNGVSYTLNTNQKITMSGTATAQSYKTFAKRIPLIAGKTYTIKGVGVANNYRIILAAHSESAWVQDIAVSANTNTTFTYTGLPEGATHIQAKVHVYNGTSVDTTISPIMVEGTSVGSFEAYQPIVNNLLHIKTDTAISSHDFDYSQAFKRSKNKNLIVYPFNETTKTANGVTFTDNKDGSVKINGTATATTYFRLSYNGVHWMHLPEGTYTLSGATTGSSTTYQIELGITYNNGLTTTWKTCQTGPTTFTTTGDALARINIKVVSGATISNVTVKPQLERGTSATSFIKGDATGQVWIQTDSSASVSFNAIKRNEIMVYPKKIKQWNGSSWKALDGILYKNGTSVQTYKGQVMLLNGQALTNGVTANDTRGSLNGNYGYNPLVLSSSGVTLNTSTGNGNKRNSLMTLTPKINLTEYSTINFYFSTFSVKSMKSGDKFRVGVTTSAASNLGDYAMRGGTYKEWSSPSTLTTKDYGAQTYTVDISSLSGEYYVYWDSSLQAQYSSSSDGWPEVNFVLNKIYLE